MARALVEIPGEAWIRDSFRSQLVFPWSISFCFKPSLQARGRQSTAGAPTLLSAARQVKHTLSTNTTIPKSGSETPNALTTCRHSPEKRRIQANGHRRRLTEAFTTTLRDRKWRTGSSGNVCSNWGYLATPKKADAVNQRGVGVRRETIWLPKTNTYTNTLLENLARSRFSERQPN
jgi:hypothetical protein